MPKSGRARHASSSATSSPRGRHKGKNAPPHRGAPPSPSGDLGPPDDTHFRALAETTAAITFVHCDEKLVYVNPAATRITGYERRELLEKSFWELIDPPFQEEARARARARLRGEAVPVPTEVKLRTKSGEPRWLHLTAAVVDHQGRRAILGTAFDITEQKRAVRELLENQKRFRALIEHSSDLMTLTDAEGKILYVSPNIGRMLGYDAAEVVGQNALELVHPHDVEATFTGFAALLGHPGRSVTLLYRCRHKNGAYRWMESIGTNVSDDLPGGTVLINKRDVTDRLRAEEDARQRRAELAHVLRVGAVSEMASGMAHEISQPLSVIVNYASGCLRRLEQSGEANEFAGPLGEIADQARRAMEIVNGLKRFVRKEPPRRTPIDLNRLVDNVVRLLQREIHDRGIELRRDLARALPTTLGDEVLIEQVIFNLLRNGIEAVVRTEEPGWLSVRTATRDESQLEVAIADSGPGLPSPQAAMLFQPFFTTKGSGLGMGLTISRAIAEAHGGSLTADTSPPRGCVFRLVVPITSDDDAVQDTAALG